MKKQLLALAIVIAFATSLQAAVRTNEPIFIPTEILDEVKTLPIEIKTPINKIVDPNFKDLQPALLQLEQATLKLIETKIQELHKEVALLDKNQLLDLHKAAMTLHKNYKLKVMEFEMALSALERKPLSTRSYNNLITRLVDLYNGHPQTLLGTESTASKIYKVVADFTDKLNKAADQYNNTISGIVPKAHKITDKGQHFIAYAIGRLAIYQSQIMSINQVKTTPNKIKTTRTVPVGPEKKSGKVKMGSGPVITNNK